MSKGRLVYISNTRIPSAKANTYQSFCVCEAFARQGLEVEFWHPARKGDYSTHPGGEEEVFRHYDVNPLFRLCRLPALDLTFLMQHANRIWFYVAAASFSLSAMWRLGNESRGTVIYTRDSTTLSLFYYANRLGLLRLPVFYEAHRFSDREVRHVRDVEGVVVVNACLKEEYEKGGKLNILVAHDCIREETFLAPSPPPVDLAARHGFPARERFATYIGRFKSRGNDKGIEIIVRCMKHVRDAKLRFLFVGGPLDAVPGFRRLMREEGVEDSRALFLDGQPVHELRHFHSLSSVLLMPYPRSKHHALQLSPLKMFEYMSSKRPIVASDLPSIREVLNEENALFCRPDDPEDLAKKIDWVLENDCTALSERAWQDVQRYTWDKRGATIVGWMRDSGHLTTKASLPVLGAAAQLEAKTPKKSLIDQRFKKNLLFNYATQAVGITAGFVTTTLIARNAGLHTYGLIGLLAALGGVLTNLLSFRTNEAVVSFYKKGEVENDPGSRRLALVAGMLIDLCVGLFLYFLVSGLAPFIARTLLKEPGEYPGVALYAGIMLSSFLRGTPLGLLIALERFRLVNLITLTEQLLKMLAVALLVHAGSPVTLRGIVTAYLVPAVAVTLFVYCYPVARLARLRGARIPRGRVVDYAQFSISTFVSSTLKAGNQNVDTVVLGVFTTPAAVGAYTLFRQFLAPISMVTTPFSSQSYPRFSEAVARRRLDDISQTVRHANRLLMKAFLALCIVIVPGLFIYDRWNGLGFTWQHYLTFALLLVNALVLQRLWWCRPFAVAFDPNISLRGNLIYSLSLPLCLVLAVSSAGLIGVGAALTLTALLQWAYWSAIMRKAIHVQY
ncbi:glycosyltransferase [Geomonas subterranea]|uniref:Glycosyltransferase n=1 Tax=Geomonas subterranea TaxID=2847989 RepID=A0ABX8LJM6_9BACT|nr:glycosyltransferase [Geomonas subterranea]QXE91556.1 glycosyltransferase [Geomonas subterranea]QXM10355.1 glycosyltransferase [Geomonas subterranea]